MSGREHLDRRTGLLMRVTWIGAGVGVIGLMATFANPVFFPLAILGMMASASAILCAHLALRCPWCRKRISLLMNGEARFNADVMCCPYCRHEFDDQLPEHPRRTEHA